MTIQDLLTKENAQNWKTFVADFVTLSTKAKKNRELVRDYQVKKSSKGYTILVNGINPGYGTMTAETLYGWMERLPLVYYSRQADEYREILLSQ